MFEHMDAGSCTCCVHVLYLGPHLSTCIYTLLYRYVIGYVCRWAGVDAVIEYVYGECTSVGLCGWVWVFVWVYV